MITKNVLLAEYQTLKTVFDKIENIIFSYYNVYNNYTSQYDYYNTQNCSSLTRYRYMLEKQHIKLEINEKIVNEIKEFSKQMPVFEIDSNENLIYYRENGQFIIPLVSFFQYKRKIENSYNIRNLSYISESKKGKRTAKAKAKVEKFEIAKVEKFEIAKVEKFEIAKVEKFEIAEIELQSEIEIEVKKVKRTKRTKRTKKIHSYLNWQANLTCEISYEYQYKTA